MVMAFELLPDPDACAGVATGETVVGAGKA